MIKIKGKVNWYNSDKRYGFIIGEDGKDYFMHASQFQGILKQGDEVYFDPVEGDKGMKAHNVVKEAK